MTGALDIAGVSYTHAKRQVLHNVSFNARAGEVTMLLGPNGAGKTTLLSLVTGLLAAQAGTISCDRNSMGVVFQQPALDLELTVAQNLAYYASLHGISRSIAAKRSKTLLEPLDLAPRVDEKVRNLNGGHRRRVEIVRALMASPALLLLDEPTTGLDIPTRKSIVSYIHSQAREKNMAVLWTTHLSDEVLPEDHVIMLQQGKVVMDGKAAALDIAAAFAKLAGGSP